MRAFCVCMKNAEKIRPFKIFLWFILKDQTFSVLMQVKKFLTNRVCQECFLSAEFAYFRRSSPSYKRSLGRRQFGTSCLCVSILLGTAFCSQFADFCCCLEMCSPVRSSPPQWHLQRL